MTDAALPVTQSAVESFTERYLLTHGATIEKQGDRWHVTIPEDASEVPIESTTLVCGQGEELEDGEEALHPESDIFLRLIDEASTQQPMGGLRIDGEDKEVKLPPSITNVSVNVHQTQFFPYYDRNAVVVLFRVSIETVSEYEAELLRVVAVDTRTQDPLPGLAESYLDETGADQATLEPIDVQASKQAVERCLSDASDQVQESVEPTITEIHEGASRAADAELEEYHQLQQQRIDELNDETKRLATQIEELSETAQDTSNQNERIEALRERKELRSQYESHKEKLEQLIKQREQGFPQQQWAIRERHEVNVRIKPVAMTFVEYEAGDLEIVLRNDEAEATFTVGYGSGVGVTEELTCGRCGELLTADNPVRLDDREIIGMQCCVH